MKKILSIILLFCICSYCYSEVLKLKATYMAYKYERSNGYWTNWSEWEPTDILIVINVDKSVINIYSEKTQEFDIIEYLGETNDNDGSGGTSMKFLCIDKNGLRCHMRFRKINNQSQLYIDYSNLTYVYSVEIR